MPDPDILAGAQAIRSLMPTGVKNVPWDRLDDAARDRLKQIAQACCDAAWPVVEPAPPSE